MLSENGATGTVSVRAANTAIAGAVTIGGSVANGGITYQVTEVAANGFTQCASITSVAFTAPISTINAGAFTWCGDLTTVAFPATLTTIGRRAFYGCQALAGTLAIPASVGTITEGAFGVTGVTAFSVDAANQAYVSVDGVVYSKPDRSVLVCYPAARTGGFVVPDHVTAIARGAFWGCWKMTAVTVSNPAITSISVEAFAACSALSSVSLGVGVGSLGMASFYSDTSLATLVSYGDIETISGETNAPVGTDAFNGVTKANVAVCLPTGVVGGRTLAERQQTWKDAGFTNFQTLPEKVVTFDAQGGSSTSLGQVVAAGAKATRPEDPVKEHYTFGGWYENAACTGSAWDFATDPVNESVTLYAKWTANSHTVTFDSAGGTPVASQTVAYGEKVAKPIDPMRPGYEFAGWRWDDDGDPASTPVAWDFDRAMPDADVTLTAEWTLLARVSVPLAPAATVRLSDRAVTFEETSGGATPYVLASETPVPMRVVRIGLSINPSAEGALPGDGARAATLSVNGLVLAAPTGDEIAWTDAPATGFSVPAAVWDAAAAEGAGAWQQGLLPLTLSLELASGQLLASPSAPVEFGALAFELEVVR